MVDLFKPASGGHGLSRRGALIGVAGGLMVSWGVQAQQPYPNRPIHVVIPALGGSSPDLIARFWSERLQKVLGQPIVIDNKPGAGTIVAAQAVASAPPDGYSLLFTIGSTTSINPFIYPKLPYKTEDFVPVIRVVTVPFVMVVSATSPYRSLQDLVRAAKEKPNELAYASYGVGNNTHVALAAFTNRAGIKMNHVPYRDGGFNDIVGGLVTTSFLPSSVAVPFVKSGRLRALAVTSPKRLDPLPDVPSIAETFPGFEADGWQGLFAPRGTPPEVVSQLASALNTIIESEDFRAKSRELVACND